MTEKSVEEIFSKVGKKFNFPGVETEAVIRDEFKITWIRGYRWVKFSVPQEFWSAPASAVEEIITKVFQSICGQEIDKDYTPATRQWVDETKQKKRM